MQQPWAKGWCPPNLVRVTSPPRANPHQQHEEIACCPSEQEQGNQAGYPGSACAAGPQISVGIAGRGQAQMDVAIWCKEGGLEAEDLLDAIDSGRPHPLLRSWKSARLPSARHEPARAACPPFGCLALRCAGASTCQATGKTAGFAAAGVTVGLIRPAPIRLRARALATGGGTCTYALSRSMCYRERHGQRRPRKIKAYFVGLLRLA